LQIREQFFLLERPFCSHNERPVLSSLFLFPPLFFQVDCALVEVENDCEGKMLPNQTKATSSGDPKRETAELPGRRRTVSDAVLPLTFMQ
jgi:hypothetical protein